MNCLQCKLPIIEGEPHVEIHGEPFHASQIQCSVAIERERCAKIAEKYSSSCEDWANPTADIATEIRSGK